MIAGGYTDLVTPYLAGKYLIGQLPELIGTEPIRVKTYAGGHMMYLRRESRRELKEDARSMYSRFTGQR
jgi:carboxypeptidase C (cathepsin A)